MSSVRTHQRRLRRRVEILMEDSANIEEMNLSDDNDYVNRSNVDINNSCEDVDSFIGNENSTDSEYYPYSSESEEECGEKFSFRGELTSWALRNNITAMALDELLYILRKSDDKKSDLPLCSKTLLKTPTSYNILKWGYGEYFHFGISKILCKLELSHFKLNQRSISLIIGIDGIPISRSSKKQFWPILGKIDQKNFPTAFLIGLFYGDSKPLNCNEYLSAFILEMQQSLQDGVVISGHKFDITKCIKILKCIFADAPARSYLKGVKSHNGYFACERCTTKGIYDGTKVIYPELVVELRTNDSFRSKSQPEHHTSDSPLLQLSLDMISQFPLDYLHLVCLGVMRKLLNIWCRGKVPYKQSQLQIDMLSGALVGFRRNFPSEFHRKPRSTSELEYWKGSEYRNFLLYSGVVALKNILNEDKYKNFLLLSCGVRVLLSDNKAWYSFGRQCLNEFAKNIPLLYSDKVFTYNMHSIIH